MWFDKIRENLADAGTNLRYRFMTLKPKFEDTRLSSKIGLMGLGLGGGLLLASPTFACNELTAEQLAIPVQLGSKRAITFTAPQSLSSLPDECSDVAWSLNTNGEKGLEKKEVMAFLEKARTLNLIPGVEYSLDFEVGKDAVLSLSNLKRTDGVSIGGVDGARKEAGEILGEESEVALDTTAPNPGRGRKLLEDIIAKSGSKLTVDNLMGKTPVPYLDSTTAQREFEIIAGWFGDANGMFGHVKDKSGRAVGCTYLHALYDLGKDAPQVVASVTASLASDSGIEKNPAISRYIMALYPDVKVSDMVVRRMRGDIEHIPSVAHAYGPAKTLLTNLLTGQENLFGETESNMAFAQQDMVEANARVKGKEIKKLRDKIAESNMTRDDKIDAIVTEYTALARGLNQKQLVTKDIWKQRGKALLSVYSNWRNAVDFDEKPKENITIKKDDSVSYLIRDRYLTKEAAFADVTNGNNYQLDTGMRNISSRVFVPVYRRNF